MSVNFTGSCLCKSVQYVINGEIKGATNCHCNICKKITGAAFETIAVISENNFEITKGKKELTAYRISENATKHFCNTCGTPIFNLHKKYPGRCMVHLGSLDDPTSVTPKMNIFCESMLPWVEQISTLTNFEQLPIAEKAPDRQINRSESTSVQI